MEEKTQIFEDSAAAATENRSFDPAPVPQNIQLEDAESKARKAQARAEQIKNVQKGIAVGGVVGGGAIAGLYGAQFLVKQTEVPPPTEPTPEPCAPTFSTVDHSEKSFQQAFESARSEVGSDGYFLYKGQYFHTHTDDEWAAMDNNARSNFQQSLPQEVQNQPQKASIQPDSPIIEPPEKVHLDVAETEHESPETDVRTNQRPPARTVSQTFEEASPALPADAKITEFDVDQNGVIEIRAIDTTGDGIAEAIITVNPNDPNEVVAIADTNRDDQLDSTFRMNKTTGEITRETLETPVQATIIDTKPDETGGEILVLEAATEDDETEEVIYSDTENTAPEYDEIKAPIEDENTANPNFIAPQTEVDDVGMDAEKLPDYTIDEEVEPPFEETSHEDYHEHEAGFDESSSEVFS